MLRALGSLISQGIWLVIWGIWYCKGPLFACRRARITPACCFAVKCLLPSMATCGYSFYRCFPILLQCQNPYTKGLHKLTKTMFREGEILQKSASRLSVSMIE